jgi:hypothetical protein
MDSNSRAETDGMLETHWHYNEENQMAAVSAAIKDTGKVGM